LGEDETLEASKIQERNIVRGVAPELSLTKKGQEAEYLHAKQGVSSAVLNILSCFKISPPISNWMFVHCWMT